jgi:1-acyl-sn-glycerol-3-phosphate acyltransferase
MTLAQRVVGTGLRVLTTVLCRVDDAQLARVPQQGPLIIITNHVGLVEIPLLHTRLQPRRMSGFVAAKRWRNPLLAWLLDLFEGIPLRRGEADIGALRQGLEVLERGDILFIMPEGTRSGDGRLQRGHGGLVFVAQRSGAPILPLVHYGSERLADNLRRFRRTDFHFRVGQPFTFDTAGVKVSRAVRQQVVDEAMYQMAELLPPDYRGVYSELAQATRRYVRFAA